MVIEARGGSASKCTCSGAKDIFLFLLDRNLGARTADDKGFGLDLLLRRWGGGSRSRLNPPAQSDHDPMGLGGGRDRKYLLLVLFYGVRNSITYVSTQYNKRKKGKEYRVCTMSPGPQN